MCPFMPASVGRTCYFAPASREHPVGGTTASSSWDEKHCGPEKLGGIAITATGRARVTRRCTRGAGRSDCRHQLASPSSAGQSWGHELVQGKLQASRNIRKSHPASGLRAVDADGFPTRLCAERFTSGPGQQAPLCPPMSD